MGDLRLELGCLERICLPTDAILDDLRRCWPSFGTLLAGCCDQKVKTKHTRRSCVLKGRLPGAGVQPPVANGAHVGRVGAYTSFNPFQAFQFFTRLTTLYKSFNPLQEFQIMYKSINALQAGRQAGRQAGLLASKQTNIRRKKTNKRTAQQMKKRD